MYSYFYGRDIVARYVCVEDTCSSKDFQIRLKLSLGISGNLLSSIIAM